MLLLHDLLPIIFYMNSASSSFHLHTIKIHLCFILLRLHSDFY